MLHEIKKKTKRSSLCILLSCLCMLNACTVKNATPTAEQSPFPSDSPPTAVSEVLWPTDSRYMQSPYYDSNPNWMGERLPPVDERLPKEPLVLDIPDIALGQYTSKAVGTDIFWEELNWEPEMIRDPNDPTVIVGNVFASMEANDEYKVFNFKMRPGLRWSDGALVTSEDVRFALEDCWANEEFTIEGDFGFSQGMLPTWCMPDPTADNIAEQRGIPVIRVLDEYNFQLEYRRPFYGLANALTLHQYILLPSSYLRQLHPKYTKNEEEVLKNLASLFPETYLFGNIIKPWFHMGMAIGYSYMPTLGPWISDPDTLGKVVRNPYYWKVDTAGRQLPYIDQLIAVSRIDAGTGVEQPTQQDIKINFDGPKIEGKQIDDAQEHAIRTQQVVYDEYLYDSYLGGFCFTYGSTDTWWAEMVQKRSFRQALLWAVDSQKLTAIEAGTYGNGDERWPYDPKAANAELDKLFLAKDADGFRKWDQNDETVVLSIAYFAPEPAYGEQVNMLRYLSQATSEYLKEAFEAVGIKCKLVDTAGDSTINIDTFVHVAADFTFNLPTIDFIRNVGTFVSFYFVDKEGHHFMQSGGGSGRKPLPEVERLFTEIMEYEKNPTMDIDQMYKRVVTTLSEEALCYPGVCDIPFPITANPQLANISFGKAVFQRAFRNPELWFLNEK